MNGYEHFEADMFFEVDGQYQYDHSKIREAHDWCVENARKALDAGKNVVVSNTFLKLWEMKRYIDFGYPVEVIEMKGRWKNIHGIPDQKISEMAERWEEHKRS